jgi:mannose-6-phosphate isomerase-like protein (cupin superfamily)
VFISTTPRVFISTWFTNEVEIAYAPSGVETREVKDSTFKVAKLFSQSFMGSGLVELPPNGVKRPKNAKRMHMIFCVCQGRVQVDINGVQFTAGKGCMFQVPRGVSLPLSLSEYPTSSNGRRQPLQLRKHVPQGRAALLHAGL